LVPAGLAAGAGLGDAEAAWRMSEVEGASLMSESRRRADSADRGSIRFYLPQLLCAEGG